MTSTLTGIGPKRVNGSMLSALLGRAVGLVGTSTATCLPPFARRGKRQRIATSGLGPKPTVAARTRRSMG